MTDDLHHVHIPGSSAQPSYDTPPTQDADIYHRPDLSEHLFTASAVSNAPTTHNFHPRPETRDIWEEEDGRRMRLALDGEAPQDVPQFDLIAALSHPLRQRGLHSSHEAGSSPTNISTSSIPITSSQRGSRRPSSHAIQPLWATQFISADSDPNRLTEIQLDEDALEVDDPRRNYDFADFMDSWRLRSMRDRRLPRFEPGLQSSVRIGRPDREVSRKAVVSGAVDSQGLPWKLLGPPREHAMIARAILHPSRINSTYIPFEQTHSHQTSSDEERQYRFRSFLPMHRARFTHYQLRNVLAASSRNEVFYATGSQVQRASLACPGVGDTVMDLFKPSSCAVGFRVTCLSASRRDQGTDGVVLAGGFYGEYAVLKLDSAEPAVEGFVTHSYNGLVTHVHDFADRRSGLLQAAFCSNDRQVRLMDVATLKFTNTFSYENAVNCSATSPDGRLRVLAGDSQEVLITDASRGDQLVALQGHNDHGFACDWSADGRYVASAAQEGKTMVWDARNWSKPVRTLGSVMSCARSLHFTDDGALVVAENDDVVRVYDSGNFDIAQDIRLFGSIAGLALIDGGAEMAVANADKTVGGLLTLERTPQGLGSGSYGKQIAPAGGQRSCRWRSCMSLQSSNFVSDFLI